MSNVNATHITVVSDILKRSNAMETKLRTLDFFLGLTESEDGLSIFYNNGNFLLTTFIELFCGSTPEIAKKVSSILINISADQHGANLLMTISLPNSVSLSNDVCKTSTRGTVVCILLDHMFDSGSFVINEACIIAANLSRNEDKARKFYETLENANVAVKNLTQLALNSDKKYNHVVSVLSNLSQLKEIQKILLYSNEDVLQKLLSLVEYKDSLIRRRAAVGFFRNLCLLSENHPKLLDPNIDLISRILLPLAGPEEFDEEDNEKLPLDLQYLPSDKMREPDPVIRQMLLEILMQLSATRFGRDIMRKCNVYIILRELHNWEVDDHCITTCEDLVNILIRTEEEIGVDNLQTIDIPADLIDKFSKMKEN